MANIDELLSRHCKLSFPEHSEDDALDDLLLELSEYDGYLVGIASGVADGGKPQFKLNSDEGLLKRITAKMDALALPERQRTQIASYVESLAKLRAALERGER